MTAAMPEASHASRDPDPALEALRAPRFETVPMRGLDAALDHLPPASTVTVTCSPQKGLEATMPVVRDLLERGHRPVPHLAARMMRGVDEVEQVLAELTDLGVREVFVVAGDARTPAGPFDGAVDLLQAMDQIDAPLERVGVTGYPESHPLIPDETAVAAMAAKVPYADYLVSQICYDPQTVIRWVHALRSRGVALPLHIGVPGVVDRARLLRISRRIGLADSVRFLRSQPGVALRTAGGYAPDALVEGLRPLLADPANAVHGWHLFTFNEIESTERWRRALLARTPGENR